MSHPAHGTIELHRCILGVRVPGSRRSLDGSSMRDPGLSQNIPAFGAKVRAPSIPVLAAHVLAHGLVQHGYGPASYPLFRLLADLQDLQAAGAQLPSAMPFLREVDQEDLDAVETLLDALKRGAALELPPGAPRALLEHFLAGPLDPSYSVALKSDPRYALGLSDLDLPRLALRRLWKVLFLSRQRVDAIYGRPSRPGGYLARQLFRPVDLGLRLAASIGARRKGGRDESS